jgi:hypothetical protein
MIRLGLLNLRCQALGRRMYVCGKEPDFAVSPPRDSCWMQELSIEWATVYASSVQSPSVHSKRRGIPSPRAIHPSAPQSRRLSCSQCSSRNLPRRNSSMSGTVAPESTSKAMPYPGRVTSLFTSTSVPLSWISPLSCFEPSRFEELAEITAY